ncbi:micrococcal nuclease [Branchiibius hedensis]|uniref:Endonuclease YncB, thermonuclease family n=1 Tax=Branchiibius hedensis TaxID=672460 RepID=A0A2Y9A0L0_9MICO|nr:thermonuclease family protein [Branchiibius hedensis]PWJ27228.1 micrococcal nuclease [Branchiibius hedensis]SSA36039.1 Endonuclease YncB, thermonuclease family [Branchiibius hedensis]
MSWFGALPVAAKVGVAVTGLAVATTGTGIAVRQMSSIDQAGRTATVTHVVDGDTVDVMLDGMKQRVRLLNVNTPESVDPDKPVECMANEASAYLRETLPIGSTVRVETDVEEHDSYGRLLAGIWLDGRLINAEIARNGFGVAMKISPNGKFYSAVEDAQQGAIHAKVGLYDPDAQCTVPGAVATLETMTTQAASAAAASPTSTTTVSSVASCSAPPGWVRGLRVSHL